MSPSVLSNSFMLTKYQQNKLFLRITRAFLCPYTVRLVQHFANRTFVINVFISGPYCVSLVEVFKRTTNSFIRAQIV